MSTKWDDLALLSMLGKTRRQLNLRVTHALKPMGIGPKQALLISELRTAKTASATELARLTYTDPTATGKIIESLIKKGWVKRSDDPEDRRSWKVSLTKEGTDLARQVVTVFRAIAKEFCSVLDPQEKDLLARLFKKLSSHLETCLDVMKEAS